jgi:hypothetical protein
MGDVGMGSALGGVLRAKGALAAEVQRIIRAHCEKGNAAGVTVILAEYLLSSGMSRGEIPLNAGIRTGELLERAEEAILRIVNAYHDAGGVLTARGFVSILGLAAEMAKQWISGFAAPIPVETVIKGTLSDPEIQDRLTVVALKVRQLLLSEGDLRGGMTDDTCDALELKVEDLEGICRRAAIAMFLAFQNPNEANHEIIHKEKP